MSKTTKGDILESLDCLDNFQAEKVLTYIKSIVPSRSHVETTKKEALKEIRRAIRRDKGMRLTV